VASGKGTRNLYSDSEVFKLAIANRLRDGSVGFRAIRYVIEEVDLREFLYGRADWLVLRVRGDDIAHRTVPKADLKHEISRREYSNTETIYYLAWLSTLLEEVQTRIDSLMKDREDLPS
jgi:hypothetical protein